MEKDRCCFYYYIFFFNFSSSSFSDYIFCWKDTDGICVCMSVYLLIVQAFYGDLSKHDYGDTS